MGIGRAWSLSGRGGFGWRELLWNVVDLPWAAIGLAKMCSEPLFTFHALEMNLDDRIGGLHAVIAGMEFSQAVPGNAVDRRNFGAVLNASQMYDE
jgi:hypothetical protein